MPYAPKVNVLWFTACPDATVGRAAKLTQMNPYIDNLNQDNYDKLIEFLYKADHRSVFQHVHMSVFIYNISRSCADQVRTHHHLSVTSTSQHYTNHSGFPIFCEDEKVLTSCEASVAAYSHYVLGGVPKAEARQCLPMGIGAALYVTANAQAWAQFVHTRLCKRNTPETRALAMALRNALVEWFPQLFNHVGPQCFEGRCKQGPLSCGEPIKAGGLME